MTGKPLFELIYSTVRMIPSGRVASYGQIAQIVGSCSAQMIGFALAALPDGSNVPWQRVVNRFGRISPHGYGFGSVVQRDLLEAEGVVFNQENEIDLEKYGWFG